MLVLGFKMFLRRRGLFLSVLSIGFLVAILVGTGSVVNYINLQSQVLGGFINPGGVYIVLSKNSTSITDSRVDVGLVSLFNNVGYIKYVVAQRMLNVSLFTDSGVRVVYVRGVSDVGVFLKMRGAYLSGGVARNWTECDVGELFARVFSIRLGDSIRLGFNGVYVDVKVVGLFKSQTQSDAELIVPIETVNKLVGDNNSVSFIEFGLKDGVDVGKVGGEIMSMLPGDVKLVHVQQLKEFVRDMNLQVLDFLSVWSVVVYMVVVGASYVIVTRFVIESNYELFMVRVLGGKRFHVFGLILMYTMVVAVLGSVFGIALGVVSVQIVSTVLRWFWPSVGISPFFDVDGVFLTFLLVFVSAVLGGMYPAFKVVREKYVGQFL
jgi:ABC-type lipoprotein release transport system permease subunit